MFSQLEDLDPMNDVLFKYIFGSDDRKHITIDFLNAVLNREGEKAIKEIEFPNVEFPPQHEGEKLTRIDIFAIIDDNERIDIEVQCINLHNMAKRSLYYWAQMFLYQQSLKKAQDYIKLKPAITINVLNFKFLPYEDCYSNFVLYNIKNKYVLTDAIELYFLEVPKFHKKPFNEMNHVERWLAFFSRKFSKSEKEEIAMAEPAIQDAIDASDKFFFNEKEYWAYMNRQAAIMDYNSAMNGARAEGIAEGIAEGENKILRLANELAKAGRTDDLAKILADKSLLPKFYEEFGIE